MNDESFGKASAGAWEDLGRGLSLPGVKQVGIGPIHFRVIMIVHLMIGLIAPPAGMVLSTIQRLGNIPLRDLPRAVVPFDIALAIVLMLVAYIAQLVTFLPNHIFRQNEPLARSSFTGSQETGGVLLGEMMKS